MRTWDEALEQREHYYAQAEHALNLLETASRNTSDRTLCAALKSDFDASIKEIEEIDSALRACNARIQRRLYYRLLQRDGYVAHVERRWGEETEEEWLTRRGRRWAQQWRSRLGPWWAHIDRATGRVTHF